MKVLFHFMALIWEEINGLLVTSAVANFHLGHHTGTGVRSS